MQDEIFRNHDKVQDFIFDDRVAAVFDDMLERSVPFYSEVQRMVVELAAEFLRTDGAVYDIGCSTGNTLYGIAQVIDADRNVRYVGIEPSPGMREQAAKKLASIPRPDRVEIIPDEVQNLAELPDARVITMLYTMQFIRPVDRPRVLKMFYDSLHPGGCVLVAEKILAGDRQMRRLFIDLYHSYKMRHGYTSTEISRKREALENVLIPFTEAENARLLHEAGFGVVERIFQWYNFAAYVAVKQ